MRDPSLHIRKSDLIKLLITLKISTPEATAEQLIREGYRYRVLGRHSVEVKTKKNAKKADKFVELAEVKVNKFNMILTAARQEAGHRYIQSIGTNDRDYLMLKDVATAAEEFCKMFGIGGYEKGYKLYIQMGLMLMGKKYGLNKFKYYKSQLFTLYENVLAIREDDNPEGTIELFNYYMDAVENARNVRFDFSGDPAKYVNIVYARQQADTHQASYDDWVQAQFDGLAYLNVIPDPNQLNGDNAANRHTAFMMKKSGVVDKDAEYDLDAQADTAAKDYMEILKKLDKK